MLRKPRLREHVNPLSIQFRETLVTPPWKAIYADWDKPLSLDLGCGEGEYLLAMAQKYPDRNFLGLEIREPLVVYANQLRQQQQLDNLYFLFCNINAALKTLLPPQKVDRITIQFPDPWFKRRQQKRRLVQPELVADLAYLLLPRAEILIQSDVLDTAQDILRHFENHPQFCNLAGAYQFAPENLYPDHIPTERELWALRKERPIYRLYFVLKPHNPGAEF